MEIYSKIKEIIDLSNEPIIIEFGMYDGHDTQLMLNILSSSGKSFIFNGFEPQTNLFNKISLKFNEQFGSVSIFNIAIGSKNEVADFYVSDSSSRNETYYASSSLKKPKLVSDYWKQMIFSKQQTQVITFDNHIKVNNLENKIIDFVWADIQGAEIDLIKGGKKAFQNVKYFYTEYCNKELYDGLIGLDEICVMLPYFEVVFDYKGDLFGEVLLKNTKL
jgi:FkbM family methyltransferase